MKTHKFLGLLFAGALLLAGCSLDDNTGGETPTAHVVMIVNEGNFSDRNGSINYYYEESGNLQANPLNMSLGALYQSIHVTPAGNLWVVTNNPDRLTLFNPSSGMATGVTITGQLETPRFMKSKGDYLFVTNWGTAVDNNGWREYTNSYVAVYDVTDNYRLVKTLACGSDAEGLEIYGDKLYVATKAGVKVFDITTAAMPEITTIAATAFTGNAKQFVVDKNNKIWVSYTDGGLMCFNPATNAVEKEYPAPVDAFSGAIAITKSGEKIVSNTVMYDADYNLTGSALHLTDINAGTNDTLVKSTYNFYSIGVSPFTGNIFTADTRFDGNSTLLIYGEDGKKKGEKTAGVGTGRFTFLEVSYQQQ